MNGTVIKKKMFKTGSLRILPRSMIDVFEHNIEDKELLEWLQNFDLDKSNLQIIPWHDKNLDKIKKWKYKGWTEKYSAYPRSRVLQSSQTFQRGLCSLQSPHHGQRDGCKALRC